MLNAAGKRILNNGNNICCLYQARLCSDNSLAGVYVPKSKVAGGTYYFKTSGGLCAYASLSDPAPCNSTPLVTGETAATSCTSGPCATACPNCTDTSSSYSVSGIDNSLTNFWGTTGCSGVYAPWSVLTRSMNVSCTCCSTCSVDFANGCQTQWQSTVSSGYPSGLFTAHFTDGNVCDLGIALLCRGSVGGWTVGINPLQVWNSGCTAAVAGATATYVKSSLPWTPTGTYTLSSWSATGGVNPFPSTCTVS